MIETIAGCRIEGAPYRLQCEWAKRYAEAVERLSSVKVHAVNSSRMNDRNFVALGAACTGKTPCAAAYAQNAGYASLESREAVGAEIAKSAIADAEAGLASVMADAREALKSFLV